MESRTQEADDALALIRFTRKMSAMIDVGISLARCNTVIMKEGASPYADFCSALQERWEQGDEVTLSAAMKERPTLFSPYYVAAVRWGEIGGILEESYAQLADLLELTFRTWSLTGKRAAWGWLLFPGQQSEPKDWNDLEDLHKAFVLMLFTRSLGQMLAAGVPFPLALETAAEFIPTWQRDGFVRESEDAMREGRSWASYLAASQIATAFLTTMVDIGENHGGLDAVLEKVATVYESQIECELM